VSDPIQWTLIEAADAIKAGTISAVELTQACLARIDRLQPKLNAFIRIEAERALAAARACDNARDKSAPLHGVPLAHKDMFYRAGVPCTCGSKIRADFVPQVTATVMARLDAAGAINLGGLNMSEFAFGPTGHNFHHGPARNPWNPAHVTGGSSAGSGSAVAGRLAFGAMGSDTGGSIRLPAGICGLVGLKPTTTRVSRFGSMGLSFTLDCLGPLARTARDCARMTAAIAGADPRDATCSDAPVGDYEAATVNPTIAGLRVGVARNYYSEDLHAEVSGAHAACIAALQQLGASVVEVTVPAHDRLTDLQNIVSGAEGAALHATWLRERPQDYGPQVRARIELGLGVPAVSYLQALQLRPRLLAQVVEAVFTHCDVLVVPTLPIQVPTIAETDMGAGQGFAQMIAGMTRLTRPLNFLGLPGLSIPVGFDGRGLPIGVQLVGRPFAETTLFRVAAAYETAANWTRRTPAL
jgi:aspartyl-tRNA(Asn)/glutamyl-tRNA(Gln) amidotransferase subunit A